MQPLEPLHALGDPTRRAIFEILVDGPTSVGGIADRLPVTRSAVSQHLRVLTEVGLVGHTAAGTRHIYHIDPEGIRKLRDYLDQLWSRALTDFARAAEKAWQEEKDRTK